VRIYQNKNSTVHFPFDKLDRGNKTCAGRPGSLYYETKDATTYAKWGVDYLKLDSCNLDDTPAEVEIAKMRDALNATGRPIFFSICGNLFRVFFFLSNTHSIQGGVSGSDPLAPSLGNSWRTTTDIRDTWASMISNINSVMSFRMVLSNIIFFLFLEQSISCNCCSWWLE